MAKRILIISSEFPPGPGGIGRHAYSLAKSLVHLGATVHVVSHFDHATDVEVDNFFKNVEDGIKLHRLYRKGYKTYFNRIREILILTSKNKFDKVIVTGSFPIMLGYLLKRKFGNSLSVEAFVHGTEINPTSNTKKVMIHKSLMSVNKVWAVSSFTKSLLPSKVLDKNEVGIIPNGLNLNDWKSEGLMPFDYWKGYPKLLTVGSVTPRKGQHQVVKVLPELIKKYPDIHYHMVGIPAKKEAIIELANNLGVSEHITIHGRMPTQKELKQCYLTADIFCMLSETQINGDVEGFGIAILEANIMGLATIGSNDSGIVDAIEDGNNGYLVNAKDSDEVMAAITKVLDADKEVMKGKCVAWAHKHDWNVLAQKML